MIITIAVVLAILWLLGFSFEVGGSFVHVVLVAAVIILLYGLISRRRNIV